MAELPIPELHFEGECPDCGGRRIELPRGLPVLGDDLDWRVRDYDGFRAFLLEELAARFPERTRWTAADLEVVLVEAFAAVLDQMSDLLDRVSAEGTLATARQPRSVRRLLQMIGLDPVGSEFDGRPLPAAPLDPEARRRREEELELYWLRHPEVMEAARRAGPARIRMQRRMVTVDDYARRLEDHPLVRRAHAWAQWTGSWAAIRVAVVTADEVALDLPLTPAHVLPALLATLVPAIAEFHQKLGQEVPAGSTPRQVLSLYLDAYRTAGREVLLEEAVSVGIVLGLTVSVDDRFFRSEVRRAVEQVLGRGPGGFFEPGRLRFGEDLHASDIFQAAMGVEGVQDVCFRRFKRVGRRHPDRTAEGRIPLQGIEVAICDNDPGHPSRGYYRLTLGGGRRG